MTGSKTEIQWIRHWIEEWAEWWEQQQPYSNTTALWRTVMDRRLVSDTPQPSNGVGYAPNHIDVVESAIRRAHNGNPRREKYLIAALLCAVLGSVGAGKALGVADSTARRYRMKGEYWIERGVRAELERY